MTAKRKNSKRKTNIPKHKPDKVYVAVVWRLGEFESKRTSGGYECFTAPTKDGAIQKALAAKTRWRSLSERIDTIYCVAVGTLTGLVKEQYQYSTTEL